MATLYITEFVRRGRDAAGYLTGAFEEPPIAEQTVAIGAGSLQSNPLNAKTTAIRVHADAVCSITISANPTATPTKRRLIAGTSEVIGITAGTSPRVAVITNT